MIEHLIIKPVGVILVTGKKLSACKAAGPAVFVIGPCFHIKLFGFFDTSVDTVVPFVA